MTTNVVTARVCGLEKNEFRSLNPEPTCIAFLDVELASATAHPRVDDDATQMLGGFVEPALGGTDDRVSTRTD